MNQTTASQQLSVAAINDCYAAASYIKQGRYELAIPALQRATRAAVGSPQVWSKLMLALREVRKAARQTIQ